MANIVFETKTYVINDGVVPFVHEICTVYSDRLVEDVGGTVVERAVVSERRVPFTAGESGGYGAGGRRHSVQHPLRRKRRASTFFATLGDLASENNVAQLLT